MVIAASERSMHVDRSLQHDRIIQEPHAANHVLPSATAGSSGLLFMGLSPARRKNSPQPLIDRWLQVARDVCLPSLRLI